MNIKLHAIYFFLAFTMQFLSWKIPFREQVKSNEKSWDLLSIVAGEVYSLIYIALIGTPVFLLATHETALIEWREFVGSWNPIFSVMTQLILIDFLLYWVHRSLHHQWLWNGHAFHHSSKHLWWMSGLRASPIHVLMMGLPFSFAIIIFPTPEGALITSMALCLGIANQHWLHSNIKVPFEKHIEWLFVTPRLHFVHHSKKREFSDSNYGFIFSVWDRAFGTLTSPEKVSINEPLGLNYKNSNTRLILGLPPKAKLNITQKGQATE